MRKSLLLWTLLVAYVQAICSGSLYWDPFDNACVSQCPWQPPILYYADPSTNQCVETCPTTPSYYANDFTQSCVTTCPWNATYETFYDNYYRRCVLNCPSAPSYYAYNAGTEGFCVQYCPSGTFSLDTDRTCTAACPVYKYVNYTLNVVHYQCVAKCPKNTYLNSTNFCVNATACPSGYYGDPLNGICTQDCPGNSTTQMFADTNPNVNLCVYICPDGFYRQNITMNRTCVSACLSNYYIDYINLLCVATCPAGTYAYINGSCVTHCPTNFYADETLHTCDSTCTGGKFRDVVNNFCVVQCPPGYFGDATGGYICRTTCSIAMEYGNPISRVCVTKVNCPTPYIYADDFSRQCVTQCPQSQNTYGDAVNNVCTLNCPWASGGYYFKDSSTQKCVQNCPANPSTFADNSTKMCVEVCPSASFSVTGTRTCESSCPNNFYKDTVSRVCVSTCPTDPVNTFFYSPNSTASECVIVCPGALLADPTTMSCISTLCPSLPALYAHNNTCISQCPANHYAHPTLRSCQTTCTGLYLMDDSTWRCVLKCPTNPDTFADWLSNKCVAKCPTSPSIYFADNSTRECVTTCNQTVGYIAYIPLQKCVLICLNYTYSHNGQCLTVCPNATAPFYYIDTTTTSCVSSCPDYYFKDDYLGRCVQAGGCSNGYYADPTTRSCLVNCTSTASTYKDSSTMSCVSQCPFGYFGDYSVTNNKVCVISCPPGWFSDNSTWTCVQTCPSNPSYYADVASGTCVSECRVELDLFAYDGVNVRTCVNPCPNGTYADIYTRRCLIDCLLEPSTYMFVNGTSRTCDLTCPTGYFADNSTRECVTACPSSPNYFADWLSATCVSVCPETATTKYYADLSTRTCVDTCPTVNGTATYRDTVLRTCVEVCSGNQFADPSTGDCVEICPGSPDLFGQVSIKTCVVGCNATEDTWAENITRLCVHECPAGSYADNLTQRCVALCPVSQLTYGDNSTHRCVLTCPSLPSYYADNRTQTCVQMCSYYTYGAPVTRVCEYPLNCSTGYFADNFTKLCVANCPASQTSYAQNTTQRCLRKCPSGSYADNSTYKCVSICPSSPSYFGYQEKCLAACPNNTYADSPTRLCVASPSCTNSTWGDPTSQTCVPACSFNYYSDERSTHKICVLKCPSGYYADDLTKSCVVKCPASNFTYGTNTTRKCVEKCPENEFAQNVTRMCMSSCPVGSFADANVRVCVAVCSATPNLYGNPVDNTCVDICPSTPELYAQNSTRMCVTDCFFNQSTFADRLTRRCVSTCPVSQFTYADNHTRMCEWNCTYNTSIGVTTFADNSTLTCVAQCPSVPQYYGDISTGTGVCVPDCPESTIPKIYSDNTTRLCVPLCPVSSFYYSSNSTGRCMVVCPGGYFADNETQACVARCPGRYTKTSNLAIVDTFGYEAERACVDLCITPFFSQNSSRLCVYGCPQLEYADSLLRRCVAACDGQRRQYADNSTNQCVGTCPTLPDTFADNSTYTCVSPCPITPGVNYSCVNACPLGTWACNLTRECKTVCGSASPNQYADNYTGRCVLYCPANLETYADNLSLSCVSRCPDANASIPWPMTFADDSTKKCVTHCPTNPWTYAENSTLSCVFRCPNNSFGENNTRQCVANCSYWGTFADNSTTFCVSTCPQNSFAENASKRCLAQCPPGSYADNSTWRCVSRCPQNPALYGDVSTAVCVINCPNNYYGDDSSRTCVLTCPTNPAIFFAYDPTHRCLESCLYPYFGQPNSSYSSVYGTCQTYCFVGQYKNMTTHRCQQCLVECTQCNSLLGCTSCISGYYLSNGTCLTGCASGSGSSCVSACPTNIITGTITYADSVSRSCVEICPIKSNGGSFGYNITLYCIDSCPINYYSSNVTRRCQLCIDGCNNCTSPTVCYSCYSGWIFSNNLCVKQCSATLPYYYGSTCVASCFDGTYLMSDEITCGACSTICSTCSMIASNCTKCVGAYLYNYNCVSQCPTNYYPDSNLACQVCTASVAQCNVAPLTYTLNAYNTNGNLYGILTFNRAVNMDTARIKQIINITIPGLASSQFTWNATKTNSTTYRINIFAFVSLNQLTLSLTFINPALVIDSQGSTLSTTTYVAPLPTYDYIDPSIQKSTEQVSSLSQVLSWISLVIMLILIFKGSYALLLVTEVFQMVYFHYFVNQTLPYNFSNFLLNLKYLNFQFLPNPFSSTVPENYVSPATPTTFVLAITDTTFLISCGHYFLVLAFYALWALAVALLKNKGLNKWDKLRRFCRNVFQRRIRFGAVNEAFWFCYISFVFFGFWQFRDLSTATGWNIANLLLAFLFLFICVFITCWVVYLSIKYRNDVSKVPRKHQFILGEDSHIPFQIALRHIRKLLFCAFLAIGKIETQVMAIMAANFLMLAYYLFYKPSKSRVSNWVNILIELSYIGLQITLLAFVNKVSPNTDEKLYFGNIMMGFCICGLFFIVIWLLWQFLLFLYDFKFVRDIIEETKLANQVHPEDDNLKVQLDRQYEKDQIIPQDSISEASHHMEQETIDGIEKQFADVVHYTVEEDPKNTKESGRVKSRNRRRANLPVNETESNSQPRLISSRGSSRMLFADLNVQDLE